MANAAGRPVSPLILSANERAYLERQVVVIAWRVLCLSDAASSCDARMAYPANPLRTNWVSMSIQLASGVGAF